MRPQVTRDLSDSHPSLVTKGGTLKRSVNMRVGFEVKWGAKGELERESNVVDKCKVRLKVTSPPHKSLMKRRPVLFGF